MKLTHSNKNSGFTLVELLVVIAIIAGLSAISSPIIIRQIAKARATQALNNAKDIYGGLRDYSFDKGALPSGTNTNSDAAFEEIILAGFIQDEKPFYLKGIPGAIEGDGSVVDATAIFEVPGNNCFAYGDNGTSGFTITSAPANAPLLASPVVAQGVINATTFNVAAFGNQGVILSADGSAVAHRLSPPSSPTVGALLPSSVTNKMFTSDGIDKKAVWKLYSTTLAIPHGQ